MDTITHTLFGLTLYGAIDKTKMQKKERTALLVTALAGSQIPDIDVISAWWDSAGRYQMWHRGITHSLFLVPVWAACLALFAKLVFRVKGWLWFWVAALAVFIHNTTDILNAWGTGYYEPLSSARVTLGIIPIVDFVFLGLMGTGFLAAKLLKQKIRPYLIYRAVWILMALHIAIQGAHGQIIKQQEAGNYEQMVLSADFVPGIFTVVGKTGSEVELKRGTWWGGFERTSLLQSAEEADLEPLFEKNPKAKTLKEWSPFVVIVDEGGRLGIYDPRFYRNGSSFLFEYIDRDWGGVPEQTEK